MTKSDKLTRRREAEDIFRQQIADNERRFRGMHKVKDTLKISAVILMSMIILTILIF